MVWFTCAPDRLLNDLRCTPLAESLKIGTYCESVVKKKKVLAYLDIGACL